MNTNKQKTEEQIEPEKTQDTYAVSIPKTNLKTYTKQGYKDTPQTSRNTYERNDTSQYDKLKEMIKNINFKKIITGIKDKGDSFQEEETDSSQNPDQQPKLLDQDQHEDKIQKEHVHHEKVIDNINSTKNSHCSIKQDIIQKKDNIYKSTQHPRINNDNNTLEHIHEDNTRIESRFMNENNDGTDILILENNPINQGNSTASFQAFKKRESESKNTQVERKDAHVESHLHTHCLLTGFLAHSAMRSAHIIPEYRNGPIQDNLLKDNTTGTNYTVNHNTTNQNEYEELNPIKKPKKQIFTDIDNMQKDWEELEEIQSQQKLLLREIQQTKIEMAIKSKRYIPYHNTPLYRASFVIKSNKPTFCCTACNYNTESKSHFDNHHISKSHHELLSKWNTKQERNKDDTKDNIEYYISKTDKNNPNRTNITNDKFEQNAINVPQETQIYTSNDQSHSIMENTLHNNFDYQQSMETADVQLSNTFDHNNKNRMINNLKQKRIDQCPTEDLTTMGTSETHLITNHNNIQHQMEQNENHTSNTSINKTENSNTSREISIEESSHSDNYEIAIRKIHQKIPIQYRHNLIALLSSIYQSGTDYEIRIEIRDNFQDAGHWILSKYHKLLKNRNTRQHLQIKWKKRKYDLVSKTEEQEEEIKHIAGSARVIYDILIHCQFVPIEYLCILATLLNKRQDHQYTYSSILLPGVYSTYGEIIDLMLNVGAFYTTTEEIIKDPTIIINDEEDKIEEKPTYISKTHNQINHKDHSYQASPDKDSMTNDFNKLKNKQAQINKEELLLQITLQKSFETLQNNKEEEETTNITKTINLTSNESQTKQ